MKKQKKKNRKLREIEAYDEADMAEHFDLSKRLRFEALGVTLPKIPPTQVISLRLPSYLLNKIKAFGSQRDIPYQALIKLFLAQSIERMEKKTV